MMYSLYRAWFGAAEESYPLRLSPPDTVVRVGNEGEYHFVAHRAVLAAHSGYLKALLASSAQAVDGDSASSSRDAATPLIASIAVPSSIGGEAFGPLLHYMYTGRLEVTLDNIYTVLLATHLLHMPGALEQCRAALLRLRAPPAVPSAPVDSSSSPNAADTTTTTTTSSSSQPASSPTSNSVLRPVPNRLLGPAFCWPQSAAANHHLYPPPRHLDLPQVPTLQLSPAVQLPTPIHRHHRTTDTPYGSKEPSVSPVSSDSPQAPLHSGNARSPSASPELVVVSSASPMNHANTDDEQQGRRSASASSEHISVSDNGSDQQQQPQSSQQHQQPRRNRDSSQHQKSRQSSRSRSGRRDRSSTASSSSLASAAAIQTSGVIYDVACCDGPVRFHRVLNDNYAPSDAQPPLIAVQQQQQPHRVQSPQNNGRVWRENDENEQRVPVPVPVSVPVPVPVPVPPPPAPSASQRHAHRPISQPLPAIVSGDGGDSENRSYTCSYCQHTFKSQNCYRKHARRHLLPTDTVGTDDAPARQIPASQQHQQQPSEGKKREVRLLDLNVQYYPCKICGSKFPSYYFVHKHRKLHHANIDEPQRSSSNEQKQQQQPSTSENIQQQQAA